MTVANAAEVPPRPEEILDEDRIAYQAMSELSDEKYAQLAADIRERGVLDTILLDEDGTILDGHHREAIAQYYELDGSRAPAYLRLGDLESDEEKLARAIKQNLLGRDTTDAVKRQAVENYIELTWDRTDDGDLIRPETDTEVAEKLGVSRQLVTKVVNRAIDSIIYHDRVKAREYYENNPDASYREVAEQVDTSRPTVTEWLKEDFDEDDEDEDDDQEPLNLFARDKDEDVANDELLDKATGDGADDEVQEKAKEETEKVASRKTSGSRAKKKVEKKAAEKKVEQQSDPDESATAKVAHADAVDWLEDREEKSADLLITDPPFSTDVEDVEAFASEWVPRALQTVADEGYAYIFVGSYADELQAYLQVLGDIDRFAVQPLVWEYKNTLGATPKNRYNRNWQAILFCRGEKTESLDAPKTSELWSVQEVNAPDARHGERHHRWEKPTELIERFVRHASQEGDTVIDPFAGSGSHLLAAANLGREASGCEISETAIETAVDRGCARHE